MTDRLEGLIVTFEKPFREDSIEPIIDAIKLIRGVMNVEPVIENPSSNMAYNRGVKDARESISKALEKELWFIA